MSHWVPVCPACGARIESVRCTDGVEPAKLFAGGILLRCMACGRADRFDDAARWTLDAAPPG